MRSTNDNLTNPLHVDMLAVPFEQSFWNTVNVSRVTQFFYDHLQIRDPGTLYIIGDSRDGRAFLGNIMLNRFRSKIAYLLGPSDHHGEYIMYMSCATDYGDYLYEICRYNDPQAAINALNQANKTASHHVIHLEVRASIISFIEENIGVHDFIIGLIAMFGYQDDPRLQDVMASMRAYGAADSDYDIGTNARVMIRNFAKNRPEGLYRFYSDIYDLLHTYNFFRDDKYTKDPENAELGEPVHKIVSIMADTVLPRI